MLPDRGKGLIFLRMQNSLLRRLSKSLHTVFCGRILSFLSSVFPIAEKSGVNLRGAFNTGNVTHFDQEVERKEAKPTNAANDDLTPGNWEPTHAQPEVESASLTAEQPNLLSKVDNVRSNAPPSTLFDRDRKVDEGAAADLQQAIEDPPEILGARLRAKAEEQEARAKVKAASKAGKLSTLAPPLDPHIRLSRS